MSELATELRAIGRAINHDEYVDAGVVPLTLAHAANRIEALEAALRIFASNEAWLVRGRCNPTSHNFDGQAIAQAALAPEQDK